MKTFSTVKITVSFPVLLILLAAAPINLRGEDSPPHDAQAPIRHIAGNPAELPGAVKEVVQSLGVEDRRVIRAYMAQEVLSSTNLDARLALLNTVIDLSIWTNAAEMSLSDDDLVSSLKEIFEKDPRSAIRRRSEVALLRRELASAVDLEWVRSLVRSGRWDALPLAIRFGDRNLESYVRSVLDGSTPMACSTNTTILIVPSIYVAKAIETSDLNRLQKMELCNFFAPDHVFPEDLFIAYLASIGDKQSLDTLRRNYQQANASVEGRKPIYKDKLYWFGLLCLSGDLPGPLPLPSVENE